MKLALPPQGEFMHATTYGDEMMEAYLRPYWFNREIHNETVVFIGEEGEAKLMFEPSEISRVRSFTLDKTYTSGKDYVVDGRTIKRVKGSSMPYWEPSDYFLVEPNVAQIPIAADMSKLDFSFGEQRYLRYGEGDSFTKKQVAITYRHNDVFGGTVPAAQKDKLENFLAKLYGKKHISVMVYGDSVAVGCNASGTQYGGNVNPHMPNATAMVKQYLEKHYGADIALENQAVGGWKIIDCIGAYDEKIRGKSIDLMILRIGGNDGHSDRDTYISELKTLLDKFFDEYPDANMILQTPDLPNEQSTWMLNVDKMSEWTQSLMSGYAHADRIAVADVQIFYRWLLSTGKKGRDWLANNINHSNDFVIRAYAQIILKTMLGNEFTREIYE